jgi:ABC-type proline/glycine betaine transport system permease subunit
MKTIMLALGMVALVALAGGNGLQMEIKESLKIQEVTDRIMLN